jgi:hypothetical protein
VCFTSSLLVQRTCAPAGTVSLFGANAMPWMATVLVAESPALSAEPLEDDAQPVINSPAARRATRSFITGFVGHRSFGLDPVTL